MTKKRILLITALLVLGSCAFLWRKLSMKIALVEEEHRLLTSEYGEFVGNLIIDLERGRTNSPHKDDELIGIRVLEYFPNSRIKTIGCLRHPSLTVDWDRDGPEEPFPFEIDVLYVFEFKEDSWGYAAEFTIDGNWPTRRADQAERDWVFFPESEKEIIESLPESNHRECWPLSDE